MRNALLFGVALALSNSASAGIRVEFINTNRVTIAGQSDRAQWTWTIEVDGPRFRILRAGGGPPETSLDDGATTFFGTDRSKTQSPLLFISAPVAPTPARRSGSVQISLENEKLTVGTLHPGPKVAGFTTQAYEIDYSYATVVRGEGIENRVNATEHYDVALADLDASPAAVRLLVARGFGTNVARRSEAFRRFPLRIEGHFVRGEGDTNFTADFRSEAVSIAPWWWPAVELNTPWGVAIDRDGNVYIADTNNDAIRKVTPAGAITTFAGVAENRGSADGSAAGARFNHPLGVAMDRSGNVFVADTLNMTVRKITPAGIVTTLAGLAGKGGAVDGVGSAARFGYPYGVAVDKNGNVYVADAGNQTIRKITPAGEVSTLAGLAGHAGSDDGMANAARFDNPNGVSTDADGNIYVADRGNNTIRKITPVGEVTTLAGLARHAGSLDGNRSHALFDFPQGVATDSGGNVYVSDSNNHTIRKITPSGFVTTIAGATACQGSADGVGETARFNWPQGIAVDGRGNIYAVDTNNQTIRKITPTGEVTTLPGLPSESP